MKKKYINKIHYNLKENLEDSVSKELSSIKKKYDLKEVINIINSITTNNITIIGDPIVDVYKYCSTIGTSSKSPSLAMITNYSEEYLGGSLAVAQMLSCLGCKVTLVSYRPIKKIKILNKINKNIKYINCFRALKFPMVERIVDQPRFVKMLQIYNSKIIKFSSSQENKIINCLKNFKNKTNLFLVTDFGFGFLTKKVINFLDKSNANYALNCHLNSLNINYNYFDKYKNYSYLTFNRREFEVNFRGEETLEKKILIAQKKIKKTFAVTLGSMGSYLIHKKNKNLFPAIYKEIIDPVGCGDAYFAITSALQNNTKDLKLINFLGNVYAGMHGMTICNKEFVRQEDFINNIKKILS